MTFKNAVTFDLGSYRLVRTVVYEYGYSSTQFRIYYGAISLYHLFCNYYAPDQFKYYQEVIAQIHAISFNDLPRHLGIEGVFSELVKKRLELGV